MHVTTPWLLSALMFLGACDGADAPGTAETEESAPDAEPDAPEPDVAELDAAQPPAPDAEPSPPPDAEPSLPPDGGDAACDPATAACRVTLATRFGDAEGIDLATGEHLPLPTDGSAPDGAESPVDVSARLGRFLGLSGAGLDSLCVVGTDFATLDAVPTDESGCTWSRNVLFGVLTNPYVPSGTGQGLLVRDRLGERLYKVLIVLDEMVPEGRCGQAGEITFDYTLVAR